ncbi:hypothetical protein GGF32_008675 [Allomyces javanicus]|nr:hypothetical protein GGF32_008675 [Allomyces javanicus]
MSTDHTPASAPARPGNRDALDLGTFAHDPQMPLSEMVAFYDVRHCVAPEPALPTALRRPFIWSNSAVSLDGYLAFLEPGDEGPTGIVMRPTYPTMANVDYRMLQTGWAHSDAFIITGSILRDEPNAHIRVVFDDLIEYRQKVLGKPTQPYLVVLTRTGDIPATHPIFNPPDLPGHRDAKIIIATTTSGAAKLPLSTLNQQRNPPHTVLVAETDDGVSVDYARLFDRLYRDYAVRHLDIATGGIVIKELIQGKFLDEVRMTQAMQLAGRKASDGRARPHFFPAFDEHLFTAATAPHLRIDGVRVCGQRLLFLRMGVEYRH